MFHILFDARKAEVEKDVYERNAYLTFYIYIYIYIYIYVHYKVSVQ
jgi:hypothetical protein